MYSDDSIQQAIKSLLDFVNVQVLKIIGEIK